MTITKAITTGVVTVYYNTEAVLLAVGATALVVILVTGLTFWSKFDITKVSSSQNISKNKQLKLIRYNLDRQKVNKTLFSTLISLFSPRLVFCSSGLLCLFFTLVL